jgi:hypothetical protein
LKKGDSEAEEQHLFLLVSIIGWTEDIGASTYQRIEGANVSNCRNGIEL